MVFNEVDGAWVIGADELLSNIFDIVVEGVSCADEPCKTCILVAGAEGVDDIVDSIDTGTNFGGLEGNKTWLPAGSDSIPNTCIGAEVGVSANPGIGANTGIGVKTGIGANTGIGVKTGMGADARVVANTCVVANGGILAKAGGVGVKTELGFISLFLVSKWHT